MPSFALIATAAFVQSADGFVAMDPARFPDAFGAASQAPITASALEAAIGVAPWRDKPSWGVVATEDRGVSPDLGRFMYRRAGATVVEVPASHAVHLSQPQAVAVEAAARAVD